MGKYGNASPITGKGGRVMPEIRVASPYSAKTSAYLGTYQLKCTASDIKCCQGKAKIAFHVWDFWDAPSLSNLPFTGPLLGKSPLGENGPIGGTTWLYFDWEEEITFTGDRRCVDT